jgi:hypothetical protein
MQLVIIVESKSGGGCNLARSSTTDAESIIGQKVGAMEKKKTRIVTEKGGAMAVCIYIVGVIKRRFRLLKIDQ